LIALTLLVCGSAHAGPALLVFGDSLSAAYGISQKAGWVTLLQERLRQKRLDYTVVNASVSGETSSGGAARIGPALAAHKPAIVIVVLGSNDGLRGLPLAQMRENLALIAGAAQKAGSRVLLAGMKMPPNYGPQYTQDFEQTYRTLAQRCKCALVPFLLDGVAGRRELFLDDNLHPNEQAQTIILENVWKQLLPMLAGNSKR